VTPGAAGRWQPAGVRGGVSGRLRQSHPCFLLMLLPLLLRVALSASSLMPANVR